MSRKYWVILLVVWVMALAGAGYVLFNSPFFWVRDVQVLGCSRLSPEEVIDASGVDPGSNIFKIPLGDVAERVAAIPWVKTATSMRRLPSTIEISIVERRPVAITPHHDSFVVLDEQGWAIELRDKPGGLPLVTADGLGEIVLGQQVDSQPLRWAIECAVAFGPRSVDVAEVHADERNNLTVYMVGGLRALLGQADSTVEQKVGLLVGIINDIGASGLEAEYVDIRYEKPVVKTRQGKQAGETTGG